MPRKRPRKSLEAISKPDVTPLVDLTFLLLIVFMITAPVLENAMDVSPPELNEEIITEDHTVISITADGQYRWDARKLTLSALEAEVRALAAQDPSATIYLRADTVRQYGDVMAIMKLVRDAGIREISLVTKPES